MSSGFVTEKDLEEKRRLRQEEWEKVRRPDQPVEAPEEEYDPRSLYDRLKEQADKKQADWEEAHKLKNLIRVLDDDEVGFLDLVDQTRLAEDKKRLKEEQQELEEYRKAVATLDEQATEERIRLTKSISAKPKCSKDEKTIGLLGKRSSTKLLSGIVKRKPSESDKEELSSPKIAKQETLGTTETKKETPPVSAGLSGLVAYDGSTDEEESSPEDTPS